MFGCPRQSGRREGWGQDKRIQGKGGGKTGRLGGRRRGPQFAL